MHIKRASTEKLREIFGKYATQQINGEPYMTSADFVRSFLGQSYNEVTGLYRRVKPSTFCFVLFVLAPGNTCIPRAHSPSINQSPPHYFLLQSDITTIKSSPNARV